MTKQLLRRDSAFTLEELQTYVAELAELYAEHHPSTIYLDPKPVFALEEETLTDGSAVLNIGVELRDQLDAPCYTPPARIADRAERVRVLVVLEGGLVSAVVADRPGVAVTVIDYDSEGAEASELYAIPQSGGTNMAEAFRSDRGEAECDPAFIAGVLAAEIADPAAAVAELRESAGKERARAAELEDDEHRAMVRRYADELAAEAKRLEALIAVDELQLADAPIADPLRHVEPAE